MDLLLPIVLGVVLPILIVMLLCLLPLLDKQMHTCCKQVADDLDLNYLGSQNTAIIKPLTKDLDYLSGFKESGRLSNVIRGEFKGAVIISFPFGIAHGQNTYTYQAVLIYSERLRLPKFNLTARMWGYFGERSHICFKERSKFSRHFLLKGENESQIRDIFNNSVLDFCANQRPKINIKASGSTMMCYYRGCYLTSPGKLKAILISTQTLYRFLNGRR